MLPSDKEVVKWLQFAIVTTFFIPFLFGSFEYISYLCIMLQRLFGFDPAQHQVRTEIYAGVTTFLTMAYILAVNPGIFSALEPLGMPTGAVFTATGPALHPQRSLEIYHGK